VAARERRDERFLRVDRARFRIRNGTTLGDDDAGTSMPPSNAQTWARRYLLSMNG
jgi:hypothetical protein